MLLAGLLFMVQPYYTWAQDQNGHPCRVSLDPEVSLFEIENMNPGDSYTETVVVTKSGIDSANLYLTWDWVDGDPELGELGSLFEQLILVISFEGDELYRGPMVGGPIAGDPSAIQDALFVIFMEHGDEAVLDFTVILPGPESGNEFQGSTLETELVFYTICDDDPPPPPPDRPGINIEKYTNGVDADLPTGPFIPVGNDVTWTYEVTNTGNVPLSNVEVTDNIPGVNPVYVSGDNNEDGILQVWETWIFEATGLAEEGQYANIGTVVGTSPIGRSVNDSDPSHYYGIPTDEPAINIEKATNGIDADLPTGPQITVGDEVTWTYVVTNPGNVPLSNIMVTDNMPGVNPSYVSGDVDEDGILQPGEEWLYEATGVAEAGQYANVGTVVGSPPTGANVTDSDPSHYIGIEEPDETVVDPEDPEVEPEPEEDPEVIIIAPEVPRVDPPLPRTDGVSMGLFISGLLLLLAGYSLRKSNAEEARQNR